VETPQQYFAAETERMIKLQDVLLKAMAKKITWWEAAEIIGVTPRQMRRWRARYAEHGYDGLLDRRRRRPSDKKVPGAVVAQVLQLYRERYFDFNVRHFQEVLAREHAITLSYSWVKAALQTAGLVARARKRGPHRRRRERRPLPGMLLHIDASRHAWIPDGLQDLVSVSDDATNELYYARLVPEETTRTVLEALRAVVATQGRFCALYTDRASHFIHTPKPEQPQRRTQVERALEQLGIELIAAHSPQARGRKERLYGTLQGRWPQELRVAGITLNLAPVADINTNPLNPVIGVRSFGSDPALVSRHVAAFVTGLQTGGVAACAKHFPGHGATDVDSHLDLPVVSATREQLLEVELAPFRAAIAARLGMERVDEGFRAAPE